MHINQVGQQFTYYLCVDARVAGRSKRTAWPSLGGIRIGHPATGIAGLHREMVCGPRSSVSVITAFWPSSRKNAHRDPSSEHRTQNAGRVRLALPSGSIRIRCCLSEFIDHLLGKYDRVNVEKIHSVVDKQLPFLASVVVRMENQPVSRTCLA